MHEHGDDGEESFSRGSAVNRHNNNRHSNQTLSGNDGDEGGVFYARDGDVSNRLYRIHYDVLAKRKDAAERARLEEERKNKFPHVKM
jgi:hypothetical protein